MPVPSLAMRSLCWGQSHFESKSQMLFFSTAKTECLCSFQTQTLKPTARRDGIWTWSLGRCLGHEHETLMNKICVLTKDPAGPPPPAFRHVNIQWEGSCLWARKQVLNQTWALLVPGSWTCRSRTERNTFLFCRSHSVYGICYIAAWTDENIVCKTFQAFSFVDLNLTYFFFLTSVLCHFPHRATSSLIPVSQTS